MGTVTSALATYATLGLATWTVSAAAAGALRGASTVMAPVNTTFTFIGFALLPVVFRTPAASQIRLVGRISALLVACAAAWGGILLALPSGIGRLFLGDTWAGARSVLPWTTLEYVGLAVYAGLVLGFQARREARVLAVISFVDAALVVGAAVIAAETTTKASGFAAALAIVSVVSAAGTSVVYYRRLRSTRAAPVC